MTSEPESKPNRRPPTIELKATEVEDPARTADRSAGDQAPAHDAASNDANATPHTASAFARRLKPHAVGAGLGVAAVAVVLAALWLAGLLAHQAAVPHESAPGATSNSAALNPTASSGVDEIAKRLDVVERAVAAQQSKEDTAQRFAATQAQLQAQVQTQAKMFGDEIAALTRRLDDLAATSQAAAKQADVAAATAQAAQGAARNGVQRGDVEALSGRIAMLEDAIKTLSQNAARAAASADDRMARLTVAAEALRAAVERGAPFQAELTAVRTLGVADNATAPLAPFAASGVPSAAALGRELVALVPALDRAAGAAAAEPTFLGRLKANARKLVRVTPIDAPVANDASSTVSRIAGDADRADIDAALSDIDALPDAAKALAGDWVKTAQARAATIAASRTIAADALAAINRSAAQ